MSLLLFVSCDLCSAQTVKYDQSYQDFLNPPNDSKPWAFFWWFSGYVDKPAITRHLEELKDKGLGGIVLYACASGSIPQGAEFMSPEWRALFRFAVKEAHRLDLEMGVNICYGWPAGGKWITPENNAWTTISSSQVITGPQHSDFYLTEPLGKNALYSDIIVQAIPVTQAGKKNYLHITASSNEKDVVNLNDGNYYTKWRAQGPPGTTISESSPQWLQLNYDEPEEIDYLWIGGVAFDSPSLIDVQRSDDGVNFQTFVTVHGDYLNQFAGDIPKTTAKYFRLLFTAGAISKEHIDIQELAIGMKPSVIRRMQIAAKLAKNNPIGVTTHLVKDQLNITWADMLPMTSDATVSVDSIIDITKYCSADGKINWNVPAGNWKIIRLGRNNTGLTAGGGLLVDYLNVNATRQHFDKFLKLLIDDAGPYAGSTLKYFHEDNNEIGGPYSWTSDFIEKFSQLRGYDPKPYLPVLSGQLVQSAEITDRFMQDYRRTIADLVAKNHYQVLADSAKKNQMGMQAEAGGAFLPFILNQDALMNQGKMDIPVAEFWESSNWKENQFNQEGEMTREWIENAQNVDAKGASSAGHIYGKKIIASEAFTSLGPNSHWRSAPADLLLHANIAFCEGINRFILHSSTTTKQEDGKPGYEYDAGTHFNQNVTYWKDIAPFFKFITRCENMLQRGHFVADVLYYNGDDVPNVVAPKHIPEDLGSGYDYDVCNTEVLLSRLSVKNGRVTLPDGMSYQLMVLPETKNFNLAALKKIKELVAESALITGPKPERAMGLTGFPESDSALKKLVTELWDNTNDPDGTKKLTRTPKIYSDKTAKELLNINNIPPDFIYESDDKTALIDFIHRRENSTDIYYIANRRNKTVSVNCAFRVKGKQPEIWNPVDGTKIEAGAFHQKEGLTTLPLELSPYGSTFIVFRKKIPADVQGTDMVNMPVFKVMQELAGDYQVSFDTVWGGPLSYTFKHLEDWSVNTNDSIRYFSGTARYSKYFSYADLNAKRNNELILDLGDVQNTAHVWLNGKDLGIYWATPFRINITAAIKEGKNHLVVDVTNTWINRLTGDSKLPKDKRKTKTNICISPDTKLSPSGLIGPVRLGTYSRNDFSQR